MYFGWKPRDNINGAPIPLYYDYETFEIPLDPITKEPYKVNYYGPRFASSIDMHKEFSNKEIGETKCKKT